ncbi:J domain-containing protein [Flavobacterium sp. NG2]|uniref:J domain-containing protein n=1 Tax=Flavobacterium sp. NG2 TaxID=3097547 RepID=UPI002A7F1079|nr:J domain-containing protein [Flavobacterium sp. NG2]WPR71238.1 J domain-containing protein [Flavobacterium sp. NG2]
MPFIDYYKILGIDKKASEAEIKKAYRKMARIYHPDLNPNDKEAEKKFKEINEANEVLSNPKNRKKYDQYGENWQYADQYSKQNQQQQHYRKQYGNQAGFESGSHDFSDFFESMFGGGFSGSQFRGKPQFKGQDYNAELQLDIKDVYQTHKRTLTINNKNIRLTIPAGVEDGQVIKISGHGGPGSQGGPNGDLYLSFSISNTTQFKRDNSNLFTTVDLDLYTAVLGGETTIPTFDGKVKVKVAPGTQNGTQIRLSGKGFPVYKKEGHFGDLLISYNVILPKNLSKKEIELFTELSKLAKHEH